MTHFRLAALPISLTLLAALPAQAANISNVASFTHNGRLTSSALAATIAASHVNFHPAAGTEYAGNQVSGLSSSGGFGIIAISQNTGANAVNQQAITVHIGKLVMNGASQ